MSSGVTVVSAYYEVPSKHSSSKYRSWIPTLLQNSLSSMIIFTERKHAEWICSLRGFLPSPMEESDRGDIYIAGRDERTVIVCCEFDDLPFHKNYGEYFKYCQSIDPEKDIHTPQLYTIWSSKITFLEWTISHPILDNPFKSKYIFWTDIGCCREPEVTSDLKSTLSSFPSGSRLDTLVDEDLLVFHIIEPFTEDEKNKQISTIRDHVQAGFFGGSVNVVNWFCDAYKKLFEKLVEHHMFVGKEQNLLSTLAITNPSRIHLVQAISWSPCQNIWFSFRQHWQAHTPYDFIEVGCCDFDTLIQTCSMDARGLSIEPLSCYLDKLPIKPGVAKVNVALSDSDGDITIYYVDPSQIEQYQLPGWLKGCSSVGQPHYQASHGYGDHYTSITVQKQSVPTFLRQHFVGPVDFLKVDTEGHDTVILHSWMDAIESRITESPKKIMFETNILTDPQVVRKCIKRLEEFGYDVARSSDGNDSIATLRHPVR